MDTFTNYGLLLLGTLITLLAQGFVTLSYKKYKGISNTHGISGVDIARYILDKNGLNNVKVEEVAGELTDHYDPRTKVVRLSSSIYSGKSVASISVAAHECGHAIQDSVGYIMMKIRSLIVPIVNLSSYLGYIAITIGLFAGLLKLIWIGIYAELAIVLFQVITLPVEIDASRRALKELKEYNVIERSEYTGSKVMLTAAASTYLASVATSLLQVLRLILMVSGRRD